MKRNILCSDEENTTCVYKKTFELLMSLKMVLIINTLMKK